MIALGLVACNSDGALSRDGSSPDGGAATATCGAGTTAGHACTDAPDNAPTITPTCAIGTMPSGTGGTVVAGTYQLTAQTYYNLPLYSVPYCPTTALSGTIVVGGGCLQSSTDTPVVATTSATLVIHGNIAEITPTCINTGSLSGNPDAPTWTFTATPTALYLFTMNAQAGNLNPDRTLSFARLLQ